MVKGYSTIRDTIAAGLRFLGDSHDMAQALARTMEAQSPILRELPTRQRVAVYLTRDFLFRGKSPGIGVESTNGHYSLWIVPEACMQTL